MSDCDINEYRVKITVRNNLLLTAIEEAGFTNLQEFADACETSLGSIRGLTTLTNPPINLLGEFSPAARAVMETLGAAPSDLWTDNQLTMSLKKSSTTRMVGESDIQFLLDSHIDAMTLPSPEDEYSEKQGEREVSKMLAILTERQSRILQRRMDGDSFDAIGKDEGCCKERIRQIEAKAERLLRHPTMVVPFMDAIGRPVSKSDRERYKKLACNEP